MLTVGSVCSGLGGFDYAFERQGFTVKWQVEIDKNCQKLLKSKYPHAELHTDLTRFKPKDSDAVSVIVGGTPCFSAGTLVATQKGLKPIEQIVLGDQVLTHNRRYQSVIQCMHKLTDKIVRLKIMGSPEIETTPEHPFYAREISVKWYRDGDKKGRIRQLLPAAWVEAKDLTKDHFIGQPLDNCDDDAAVSNSMAYLIGRWLGDGWLRNGIRPHRKSNWWIVTICTGKDDSEKLKAHINSAGFKCHTCVSKTVVKFHIWSKGLVQILKDFGYKAGGKEVAQWVFNQPEEIQKSIFDGWSDADGWMDKSGNIAVTTISKKLAHGMARVGRNAFKKALSVHYAKTKPFTVIDGRTVSQQSQYTVRLPNRNREAFVQDGFAWCPVRKVNIESYEKEVFNIGVRRDESYTVFGFAVHNCQDLSVAGQREGLDGERSGLFFDMVRLCKKLRPRIIEWENVPGAISSNEGRDFARVIRAFTGLKVEIPREGWGNAGFVRTPYPGGRWNIAWRCFDAQYFGVAQRRKRLFLIGSLGNASCLEILFEPESVCGNNPPSRTPGEGIAPTPASRTKGGGGLGTDFDLDGGLVPVSGAVSSKWSKGTGGPAGDECYNLVAHTLRAEHDASEDGTDRGTPLVFHPTQDPIHSTNGTTHALSCGSKNGSSSVAISTSTAVRRLTERECEKLMGLPTEILRVSIGACLDPQKHCVNAEVKCLRLPSSVLNADEKKRCDHAVDADVNLLNDEDCQGATVHMHVRLSHEARLQALSSLGKSLLCANGANPAALRLRPEQRGDIAQAIVQFSLKMEKEITCGKEGLRHSTLSFTIPEFGDWHAGIFGDEKEESAKDAIPGATTDTFTTLNLGQNSQRSDWTAQTWLCFVLKITDLFTQTPIQEGNFCKFVFDIESDYTEGFSGSVRYKMLGNSVVINVVEWIARRIKATLTP